MEQLPEQEIRKLLTEGHVVGRMAEVIRVIGPDNAVKLIREFKSTTIYVPTLKYVLRNSIALKIEQEFNGGNYAELAVKYEVSERTVRNMLEENREKRLT